MLTSQIKPHYYPCGQARCRGIHWMYFCRGPRRLFKRYLGQAVGVVCGRPSGSIQGFSIAIVTVLIFSPHIATSSVHTRAASDRFKMSSSFNTKTEKDESVPFYEALAKALKKRKTRLEEICPLTDQVARRVLEDYGAMFV